MKKKKKKQQAEEKLKKSGFFYRFSHLYWKHRAELGHQTGLLGLLSLGFPRTNWLIKVLLVLCVECQFGFAHPEFAFGQAWSWVSWWGYLMQRPPAQQRDILWAQKQIQKSQGVHHFKTGKAMLCNNITCLLALVSQSPAHCRKLKHSLCLHTDRKRLLTQNGDHRWGPP